MKGGGSLRRGGGGGRFQIVSSVFLKKSMLSLLLEYFFCTTFCVWNTLLLLSILLNILNILENKSQVFESRDCTITIHNDLYYNELKI